MRLSVGEDHVADSRSACNCSSTDWRAPAVKANDLQLSLRSGHSNGAAAEPFQVKGLACRNICCSLSCLATSLALLPDTSIQVLENRAQADSMKAT